MSNQSIQPFIRPTRFSFVCVNVWCNQHWERMLWSFCVGACDSPSLWLDIFIHGHENFVLGPRCNYWSALLHFEQWTKHILLRTSKGIKNKWLFEPQRLGERIMNTEHAISKILYITAECNGIFMVICGFNFDLGIRLPCCRGKQAISTLMRSL